MTNPGKRTHGDRRMHERGKPGLDRSQQNDRSDAQEPQPSALGGKVATRSASKPTRAEDRNGSKERAS